MGTLVVFVCSVFVIATPGTASAAVTKTYAYSCATGTGPFTFTAGSTTTITLSAPDTVTAGQTFDLTVSIPALTLTAAPAQGAKLSATLALTPTGATVTDATTPKEGPAATTTSPFGTPAGSVVYKVQVTAGQTGNVTLKPGELKLGLSTAPTTTSTCTAPTTAETLSIPIGTGGGGTDTDIIAYKCDIVPANTTDIDYPADTDIKVVLTPPTSASANADAEVKWTGTIQTTGDPLKVPTGFPTTGAKLFATIKASGAGAPATATGEIALTGITAGSDLPATLPQVTIKVKPTSTGTVTLTPGDLVFGTSATPSTTGSTPSIKCVAPTTGLKTYTFTVGNSTGTPTNTPTNTPTTSSPRPTRTTTATMTVTPTSTVTRRSQTPKAGADTGAGGEMGPDGRLFILTGTGLIAAAAVGGLVMRRRSIRG